ncbi:MAG: PLP-dependent aminotransferase family protein [Clostridia bacterium]|nr:PLP-dependent aminotransferase family protein [Clostridia bacterium]
MKYIIDRGKNVPAYLQLYTQVKDDIISGMYRPGEKLPSKRLTAQETGVSTVTVEHAYGLLCDEGYAEAHERSGYVVIFRSDDGFMASAERSETAVVAEYPPHVSESSFPFPLLAKTMRKVQNDFGERILERSPNAGCPELRTEISRYLERSRGIKSAPEQIIIGSGSEYLYGFTVDLLGRDRKYAIESPSYKKIEQVYGMCGVKFDKLPLGKDGIISRYLKSTDASVLHISPYRSFPSGVTASASKRHEYIRWAEKKDGIIIEDDFESEFSVSKKPEETLFALSENGNVIYMNTFSKTLSPSLRVGYMVLPKRLTEEYQKKVGFYSCSVPTFIQLVVAEIIGSGNFERHINRERRKKRKELLQTNG